MRRHAGGSGGPHLFHHDPRPAGHVRLAGWPPDNPRGPHVAMESTGVYWKPVYNLLEEEFTVMVVNARHMRAVPGRKTDVKDAEWIADLLQHGLLQASFIPDRPQRELRELTRYRRSLIEERSREANRIQKLLEGANIKLSSVATDVLGVSGRAMLAALAAGEEDPERLAQLAKGRLREKRAELEQALRGLVGHHQRYLLTRQLAHLFNVNYFCRLASISLAGSPPYSDPAAGPLRSGSWGRRIPGSPSGGPPGLWPPPWPWDWRRCAPTGRRPGSR